MKKFIFGIVCAMALTAVAVSCSTNGSKANDSDSMEPTADTLVVDSVAADTIEVVD